MGSNVTKQVNCQKSNQGTLILKESPGMNSQGQFSVTYTREELRKMMEKHSMVVSDNTETES